MSERLLVKEPKASGGLECCPAGVVERCSALEKSYLQRMSRALFHYLINAPIAHYSPLSLFLLLRLGFQ